MRWLVTYAASDGWVVPSSVPTYSSQGHESCMAPVRLAAAVHGAAVETSTNLTRWWFAVQVAKPRCTASRRSLQWTNWNAEGSFSPSGNMSRSGKRPIMSEQNASSSTQLMPPPSPSALDVEAGTDQRKAPAGNCARLTADTSTPPLSTNASTAARARSSSSSSAIGWAPGPANDLIRDSGCDQRSSEVFCVGYL